MKHIFIHGLGQTPDSWDKTISQLPDSEQILCPNLAEIIRDKEVNYNNLYNAFSEICNKIEEPIDLCGLSLGGVLALNYAIDYPSKVNSLVLIAAQYKMPQNLLRFQNILFRFMPKSMFQQMGFGKADFIHLCKTMMVLDFSSSLQTVSCPTLIIYGEKDTANQKASVELATLLENAKLHVVEGSGHEINIDAPDKLAELLQAFYSKNRMQQMG